MNKRMSIFAAMMAAFAVSASASAETVTTTAADGTTVYGETYFGELSEAAPVLSLFHQARSNGRGEYGPLTDWLNGLGYRVIAWDQRSGGSTFGAANRTADGASGPKGFCDAYPDLEAALDYAKKTAAGAPVVVWGSSYSAALVFQLAANHPEDVAALVAASPASGGPLRNCGVDDALPSLKSPALALRPRTEYRGRAKDQADRLRAAGVSVIVVEKGVHGSSMLVDDRTRNDMSGARADVADWLSSTLSGGR
ncbi:MAG: alpha/beta fold hydrolase [Pseudomonadota bacterium]